MSNKPLKFAVFGNEYQEKNERVIEEMLACLSRYGAEIYLDSRFYERVSQQKTQQIHISGVLTDDCFEADFAISMGGDGTFLKAASRVGAKNIPIIGINLGRLGFLADVLPAEIEQALTALFTGEFMLETHTVIQVEADGEGCESKPYAVNDIAVLKRDEAAMISIHTYVNGEYLITYQADGLIVSTPAGSTAYNLSNGGPIIVPGTNDLCLTPVAPHSLNIRPIVLSDDVEIELMVESRSHNFLIAVDGRSEKLVEGTRIRIKKAPYTIKVVRRNGQNYFSMLRNKMMWGADNRSNF